jgi:hypothetical protein
VQPGIGFYFHSSEGENSVVSGFTVIGGYIDEIDKTNLKTFVSSNISALLKP